jgi:superfamily II DNA/RNA helicase
VKDIDVVINYDMPLELEEYVHRIGRTGRANAKGIAYSLFDSKKDLSLANDLCDLLKKSGSNVP